MGTFHLDSEDLSIADQIKSLSDDELLDFWEETQYLERFLDEELSPESVNSVDYERIILLELHVRMCMRTLNSSPPSGK
ncbi:hypothetical protein [Oceanidesulfovibrio marinus]|uniref:Uncharacterized protein n=1 Tax=Oceanidesulfovibrio marinus TaxID=370038 RepID=A0A6P1ZM10_9BACT|nr:hypothetical protein [Oceanidesulfovibrio marinus]QJT08193.1 hypothetical protein E8L03_04305 [Oceanidesulfovibrio marinus]TVM35088.1 hypothetical protein DQK91_06725 [Oceanidesulfovibrio marinus]